MTINKQKADKLYNKSIEILKKVQLPNGGTYATPLGVRYPYVYPRDHAVVILGFLSAGLDDRAKKALNFILSVDADSGAFPQRLDSNGRDASYKPVQIDGTALTLISLAKYIDKTKDIALAKKYWKRVRRAVEYIVENFDEEKELVYTPNSIHEFPPTEEGFEIWANCSCYLALKRMSELSNKIKKNKNQWNKYAEKLKKGILKHLWNTREKRFMKTIRIKESSSVLLDVDASEYAIGKFKVLLDSNEKVRLTVKEIEEKLWNKQLGGICRYPKYRGRNNGGWGPWPHFTLIICRHYIRLKNQKKADQYLNWVINIAYKDQLPEHIATVEEFEEFVTDFTEAGILRPDRKVLINNTRKHPMFKKGIAYITTPLAWPHAEFIRTWNLYKETFKVK
ncbi:hypothetical protein BMS3Abin17_00608 [archaeon BMS3Abin17]|nr:hypothetical protein BMS3Abin17_00608 [archaeon BMS3Abin17]HDZ60838.1 glucoamylase [Candidatus Pacearchaeota archaeon]